MFLFPVSTAKLLGDFYNNMQIAANNLPHFAYSFVFLMCANAIGPVICTPPTGKAQKIYKKSLKTS
jgi:hypothetical protein